MACSSCCNSVCPSIKSAASCLGRCDLPKHRCLNKREVKPGPVPRNMGWLYNAVTAPEHQLRCGWRPGHISCKVLRRMEQSSGFKRSAKSPCPSYCSRPPCSKPCNMPPCCASPCPFPSGSTCPTEENDEENINVPPTPLIRIIRHNGQYSISTSPDDVPNAPSGPYPLKYVLNTGDDLPPDANPKFSIEAKFNDYQFDYTSSQSSFVLDFSPPNPRCGKPCRRKSSLCMP